MGKEKAKPADGRGGSVMRVMGEGLLRKRPCFPKTWRREPSMQMLGKGHLGGGGGHMQGPGQSTVGQLSASGKASMSGAEWAQRER